VADEAIVRIIMQDGRGGGSAPTASAPPSSPSTTPRDGPSAWQSPPYERRQPEQSRQGATEDLDRYLVAEARAALVVVRKQEELANRRIEVAEAAIRAELDRQDREDKLLELEAAAHLEVIRKRKEAVDAAIRAEVDRGDRERELLELEARAHLDVIRKQQEAAILDVEPVFDPKAEAEKRRQKERQQAQVNVAYREQYGEEKETPLDAMMKVLDTFRGTIGGYFGTLAGMALDIRRGIHEARQKEVKEERERELVKEAEDIAEASRQGVGTSSTQPSAPTSPTSKLPYKKPEFGELGNLPEAPTFDQIRDLNLPPLPTDQSPRVLGAKTGKPYPGYHEIAPTAEAAGATEAIPEALPAGGAGMMEQVAAAAGPIGMAIVAAKVIADMVTGAIKSVVGGIGGIAKGIASPEHDPSVPLGSLGEAASSASEKIMLFVPAIGVMGVAFGETAKVLSGLMQALDKTADRYGEYSPVIAQQKAFAEIRQTMGDLRRSQEVGPELAKYVQAQSELTQKYEDIKVKLLVRMLPSVTRILEVLEMAMSAGEGIEKAISTLTDPLGNLASAAAELIGIQREDKLEDIHDPTDMLFKQEVKIPNL
jgi:hypothetical protein